MQDALLRRAAARLAGDPRVLAVYGFGSRLDSGAVRPASDVDLAILVGRHLSLAEELDVRAEVVEELRRDDVDLVVLDHAPPLLRYEVVATGRRLFTRHQRAAEVFEERTYREYFDTAYLRAVQRELLREATR